jgi:ABC-type bacteriocin/lantibiotic exporter with double-glycine peptidase domain
MLLLLLLLLLLMRLFLQAASADVVGDFAIAIVDDVAPLVVVVALVVVVVVLPVLLFMCMLLIVMMLLHYCVGACAFDDAVAEVVAESFKDTGIRAFCVVAIDTVHTAMLGRRFNPEALGLAATGSYDKWVVAMGPVKDR